MAELSQGQQTSAIYWLENAEGRRAVFNDPSDPDYVGPVTEVTGLDSAEVREAATDAVEAHGGFHGNFWSGRRPITFESAITPQDAVTIADREAKMEKIRRASQALTRDGYLIWFPGDPSIVATTRVNLVPDPSFEYDVTGNAPGVIQTGETPYGFTPVKPWSDVGSSGSWTSRLFEVAAANPVSGTKSLRIKGTKDATGTERMLQAYTPVGAMPVVPGRAYSAKVGIFIADAVASSTSAATQLLIVWYDGNGTLIGSIPASGVLAPGTTGAQTIKIDGAVSPAGAASAQIIVRIHSTGTSDVVDMYIDAAQFIAESAAGAYIDGDSAQSSWVGLRGFSRSVNRPNGRFVVVRRQSGPRFSGSGMTKATLMSLVAADPRIYSTTMYRTQVAHATDAWIENQGDFPSPAVYRVYSPYNAGTVTIDVTAGGVSRQLIWTRGAGPEGTAGAAMQLDDFYRTVRLNPTGYPGTGTERYGSLDFTNGAEWPEIQPDARNKVRFDASGGGTTSATVLDVRWRDAWL